MPPTRRRGDDGGVGFLRGEERLDRRLAGQVDLAERPQQERHARLALEAPHERGPDHALVACDIEFHAWKVASSG